MKIKQDNVLVERLEQVQGGTLTSVSSDKINEGTVIAIGPKVNDITVGTVVLFGDYGTEEIVLDGKTYLSMKEEIIILEK